MVPSTRECEREVPWEGDRAKHNPQGLKRLGHVSMPQFEDGRDSITHESFKMTMATVQPMENDGTITPCECVVQVYVESLSNLGE